MVDLDPVAFRSEESGRSAAARCRPESRRSLRVAWGRTRSRDTASASLRIRERRLRRHVRRGLGGQSVRQRAHRARGDRVRLRRHREPERTAQSDRRCAGAGRGGALFEAIEFDHGVVRNAHLADVSRAALQRRAGDRMSCWSIDAISRRWRGRSADHGARPGGGGGDLPTRQEVRLRALPMAPDGHQSGRRRGAGPR